MEIWIKLWLIYKTLYYSITKQGFFKPFFQKQTNKQTNPDICLVFLLNYHCIWLYPPLLNV